MIVLTSFVEARKLDVEKMSGARWAPEWAKAWPVVEWMQPLYPSGKAIRLRDFGNDPLPAYREYVLELYRARWPEARQWIAEQTADVAVCCWCPFTQTARVQLERFGSFHCHMGVVETVIQAAGVEVKLGDCHEKEMVRQ